MWHGGRHGKQRFYVETHVAVSESFLSRQYGVDGLPPVAPPDDKQQRDAVPISVDAIVQAIRQVA